MKGSVSVCVFWEGRAAVWIELIWMAGCCFWIDLELRSEKNINIFFF